MDFFTFIDFEASSLSRTDSYPIEVGYATLNTHTGEVVNSRGFLITPDQSWTDWNPESENIHHICRDDLRAGYNLKIASRHLNDSLRGRQVVCDSPAFDGFWSSRLFHTAKVKQEFQIIGIWDVILHDIVRFNIRDTTMYDLRPEISAILGEPNSHRAEADAIQLAGAYRRIIALLASHSRAI